MFKKIKQWFFNKIGYAYDICVLEDESQTITLRSDGWVTVSDGISQDMLPITFCSQELVDSFERKLEELEK